MSNLVVLGQTLRAYAQKNGSSRPSRLSRSPTVTGTDADRSISYHGPISYRFSDKRRFLSVENRTFFSTLGAFNAPAEGVVLGIF